MTLAAHWLPAERGFSWQPSLRPRFAPPAHLAPLSCPQVVEDELHRIPPHVAARYSEQLWSITYIPQVPVQAPKGSQLHVTVVLRHIHDPAAAMRFW
jgi:hypothetical protein